MTVLLIGIIPYAFSELPINQETRDHSQNDAETMLVGKWEVEKATISYKNRKEDEPFLDFTTHVEFRRDGICLFIDWHKGRIHEQVEKKFKINQGILVLYDDQSEYNVSFEFFEDGNKLSLQTESQTMLLRREEQ